MCVDEIKDESGQEGETRNLNDIVTFGMEPCHVQSTNLKNSWLGSVVTEWPDVSYHNELFKQKCES